MNLPKIFLARKLASQDVSELPEFFQRTLKRLFPEAVPVKGEGESWTSPSSFFLRQGEEILWVEVMEEPFSQAKVLPYLTKVREIHNTFSRPLRGILAAPDFEVGIKELLELIRWPIRLFRYRDAVLEEVVSASSRQTTILPPEEPKRERGLPGKIPLSLAYARLNREELKAFIQFEIDEICLKYKS